MLFWYAIAAFLLIDILVFFYIFRHRIRFPRASACRQGICGHWFLPKCSNPDVREEEFKNRNGRNEIFPCSSVNLGFNSAGEHTRYIRSIKLSSRILVLGFIVSLLMLEVSILTQVHKKSLIEERVKAIENTIKEIERVGQRVSEIESKISGIEKTEQRVKNIDTRIKKLETSESP